MASLFLTGCSLKQKSAEDSATDAPQEETADSSVENAAKDPRIIQAQNDILDEQYMTPAVTYASEDGLSPLGQYIYYDVLVVHGEGDSEEAHSDLSRLNAQRKFFAEKNFSLTLP